MKKVKWISPYIAAILLFLSLPVSAPTQYSRGWVVKTERMALVIGNSAYQTVPLKNPVNDAIVGNFKYHPPNHKADPA
jgi:hypothetical protein